MSVVVIPSPSPSDGAAIRMLSPGSEYHELSPLWVVADTPMVKRLFTQPSVFESSLLESPFPAAKVMMLPSGVSSISTSGKADAALKVGY